MKKGGKGGSFGLWFSIAFLVLIFYGIKTCEKQAEKAQAEIRHAGDQAREGLREAGEKVATQVKETEKEIKELAEKIPKRIIGDFKENFGSLCVQSKAYLCDADEGQYCDADQLIEIEAFFGSRGGKHCCKVECLSTPPGLGRPGYPLKYVGGNTLVTCAFQKGEDCRHDKYCNDEQWIKAHDTQTCCKSACVERIQDKDVFFDGLGYATVERFAGKRFGVWFGTGTGKGFYELGKPNYAEAKRTSENLYEFTAEGKTQVFYLLQSEPSSIKVSTKKSEEKKTGEGIVEVHIKNNLYSPEETKVKEGTTVVWVNDDAVPHTVTFDDGTDLGTISPGGRMSMLATKKVTVLYHCSFHPSMKGKIIVE